MSPGPALRPLPLGSLPVLGASAPELAPHGLVLHRLPPEARTRSPDPMLALVERMPAGARLSFRTDATCLELDVALQVVALRGEEPLPAVFDLVVDGRLVESFSTVEGTRLSLDDEGRLVTVPGGPATVRFERLPGDLTRRVEAWLPHAATVTLCAARIPEGAVMSAVGPEPPRWVHYGSSISHCLEATGPTRTWPAAAALRAGWSLTNLGLAGQCMLDQFVARTIRDLPAEVISLKLGINVLNGDTYRERTFVPALHGFLDTVRDGHPSTPVVLLTPVSFPAGEDAPGPTAVRADGTFGTVPRPAELAVGALSLSRIRELVAQVAAVRQDPALHLLDGRSLFGPDDAALLHDGLHPSAEGYLLMADRFFDLVCGPRGVLAGLGPRTSEA